MLRNLHQLFVQCTASQIIGGDFAKFCGLLRIYELYNILLAHFYLSEPIHKVQVNVRYPVGQIIGGDFAKFCDLLRIYELYLQI